MDGGCGWQWGPLGAAQAIGMAWGAHRSLFKRIIAIFVKRQNHQHSQKEAHVLEMTLLSGI